jgi:hypothetical protein
MSRLDPRVTPFFHSNGFSSHAPFRGTGKLKLRRPETSLAALRKTLALWVGGKPLPGATGEAPRAPEAHDPIRELVERGWRIDGVRESPVSFRREESKRAERTTSFVSRCLRCVALPRLLEELQSFGASLRWSFGASCERGSILPVVVYFGQTADGAWFMRRDYRCAMPSTLRWGRRIRLSGVNGLMEWSKKKNRSLTVGWACLPAVTSRHSGINLTSRLGTVSRMVFCKEKRYPRQKNIRGKIIYK